MFYQCQKCKKTWQYPIEKCPDCFSKPARMESKKMKVIGVSKVSTSSLSHPKVPYFVLLLEDEKGNKWVQKFTPHRTCLPRSQLVVLRGSGAGSAKEYKIGDEFKIESSKDSYPPEVPSTFKESAGRVEGGLESTLQTQPTFPKKEAVSIWRIKYDIFEAIEKTIGLIGGLNINFKSRILILPTLVAPQHPYLGFNTTPEFLETLIKYFIEKGAKPENIKVASQSFDEISIEASASRSQLLAACQNCKVTPLDLAKGSFARKQKDDLNFEISEEVFKNDLLINLPILKIGRVSAMENLLKFLRKENYLGLKYLYSEDQILEVLKEILPECLTLAEAERVQKADGFVVFLGLALASFNFLNLDRVFFEITSPATLPEFLRKIKIEEIPIWGRKIEEVKYYS